MSLTIDNSHNDTSRIIEIDGLNNKFSNVKIYSSALRTYFIRKYAKSHIMPPSVSNETSGSVKFVLDTELN